MPGEEPSPGDLIPRPDPSFLTNAALTQAKEDLRREMTAVRELLEQRLEAMDERHLASEDVAGRIRAEIAEEIRHLRELGAERFASIARQMSDRDIRLAAEAAATDKALTAALAAARELVEARAAATALASSKYEQQIATQIAQLAELTAASRDALDDKIATIKERIDRGEGGTAGATAFRTERRLDVGQVIAVIAVLIAIASVIVIAFRK